MCYVCDICKEDFYNREEVMKLNYKGEDTYSVNNYGTVCFSCYTEYYDIMLKNIGYYGLLENILPKRRRYFDFDEDYLYQ